jgi:hypothetical protein
MLTAVLVGGLSINESQRNQPNLALPFIFLLSMNQDRTETCERP